MAPVLVATLVLTAAVYGVLLLAWRSPARAAIVTSAVIVPALLFGPIVDVISPLWPGSSLVRSQLLALLAWLVIVLIAFAFVTRSRRDLSRITEALNVVAVVIVVLTVAPIARFALWPGRGGGVPG